MLSRARSSAVVAFTVAIYLVLLAAIFFSILHKTGGKFVYALDDPYIHLAMAEQIAHGHYGINPAEASSPSSSLLWPILLLPFTGHAAQGWLPLFWNLFFGLASAFLIGLFVDRLPLAGSSTTWLKKAVLAVLLLFIANLTSLTLLGMEHVLQVFLSIACAIGIISAYERRSIPTWCLAAAVIGPSVRYENLAITTAIAIALIGLSQTRKAFAVLAFSVAPLVAFSVFLKLQGLPLLPVSVLMKRNVSFNPNAPHLGTLQTLFINLSQDFRIPERLPMLLLLALAVLFLFRDRLRWQRFDLLGAVFVALAQLLIGKFGWFHRYQVYALIFVAMILLYNASKLPRLAFLSSAVALSLCAALFIRGTWQTPAAALSIYEQQYQMHRFINDFYRRDVAVNDLGLVSYQRPPGVYVLDIYGLASPEIARQTNRTADWLDSVVQSHHVTLAIIYPDLFHVPSEWTPLAEMCRHTIYAVTGEPCVTFYNTSPGTEDADRADIARFAPTLPDSVKIAQYPPSSSEPSDPPH